MRSPARRLVPALAAGIGIVCSAIAGDRSNAPQTEPVKAVLHRAEFLFDGQSGSLLRMSYPGAGRLLDTTAEHASLVDLAYPVPQYEPLRLASRYSRGAKITVSDGQVVVHWDRLGASRTFVQVPGTVSAMVTLKAAPDGQSIILHCRVENRSQNALRQVLFPDLLGLIPIGSASRTEFRTGSVVNLPFVALAKPDVDQFYAVNQTFAEFTSTGKEATMPGRWLDLSGPQGGFSLFPRRSQWDTGPIVMLQFRERADRLRLMYSHYVNLGTGQTWESDEYWLTPHEGDWRNGREPFEAWLQKK